MDTDIQDLASKLGITKRGWEIVERILEDDPSRRVRASSYGKNRAIRFPSNKMQLVIQAESETLEFSGVLMKELDPKVLRYYDQPPKITLRWLTNSKQQVVPVTLDFFVISDSGFYYEEYKTEKELRAWEERSPDRYFFDSTEGRFRSPTLERFLEGTGIEYKIVTENHIPTILIDNLEFLYGYYRSEIPDRNFGEIQKIIQHLTADKVVRVKELMSAGISSDSVYYAIAKNLVFYPLTSDPLIDHQLCCVFLSEDEYNSISPLMEQENMPPARAIGELSEALKRSSNEDLKLAAKKMQSIRKLICKEITIDSVANEFGVSVRTVARWRRAYSEANASDKHSSLIPAHWSKGSRQSRLEPGIDEIFWAVVEEDYLTKAAKSATSVVSKVRKKCKDKGLPRPARSTLFNRIRNIDESRKVGARKGQKAKYQSSAFSFLEISDEYWVGATRYLQYVHMDHTQCDVWVVNDHGVRIAKPWITMIIDEYTTRIFAVYVSLFDPSYISLMMCIRSMVRTYGVLPECFVVDGGAEFQGKDFELLAAAMYISIKSREGQPRAGGIVERTFGTINSNLLHQLAGNSKYMKNVREVSRDFQAQNNAEWSLSEVVTLISDYARKYDSTRVVIDGATPSLLVESSNRRFGKRSYLEQEYTRDFEIFSPLSNLFGNLSQLSTVLLILLKITDCQNTIPRQLINCRVN
jgi:putative transposase